MTDTVNEQIAANLIKHQIYLIQYSNGLYNDAAKLLANTEEELEKTALFYATKLQDSKVGSAQYNRIANNYREAVRKIREPVWNTLAKTLASEMQELGQIEMDFIASTIENAIPLAKPLTLDRPERSTVTSAIENQPVAEGKILSELMDSLATQDVERISSRTVDRMTLGESASAAVQQTIGTKAQRYRDGVMRRAQTSMEAISQTVSTATSTTAQKELFSKNSYLIKDEIFRATLDSGTTPVCIENSNQIFPVGEGPYPPLHYRCRSKRLPNVLPDALETQSFDPSTERTLVKEYATQSALDTNKIRTRADLPYGTKQDFDRFARGRRRELIGTEPVNVSYGDFLRKQSAEFQREVLGNARYKLFRDSKLPLTKFINNGRYLTLEELKNKGIE